MDNEVKQRNRRRKRAQRMQAQRANKAKEGDSGEDESPDREKPVRPPNRRKKSKEPLVEEDIIDGFAILGFRTYEDLENVIALAAGGGKPVTKTREKDSVVKGVVEEKPKLDTGQRAAHCTPLTAHHITSNHHPPTHGLLLTHADAGTSDDSGRASERLTGSSVAPRDPDSSRDRLSDASSRCSSGKGYICDSEGEDDKGSDAGSVLFASTPTPQRKHEFPGSGLPPSVPGGGSASPVPAPTSPCLAPPAPSPAPAALPPHSALPSQPPYSSPLPNHVISAELPPAPVKSSAPTSIASMLVNHTTNIVGIQPPHSLSSQSLPPNHAVTNLTNSTNHVSALGQVVPPSSNHITNLPPNHIQSNLMISSNGHANSNRATTLSGHQIPSSLSASQSTMTPSNHTHAGHASINHVSGTSAPNNHNILTNSGSVVTVPTAVNSIPNHVLPNQPNHCLSNHPVSSISTSRVPSPPPPLSAATPPASLPAALPQPATAPTTLPPRETSIPAVVTSTSSSFITNGIGGYQQTTAFPSYPPLYAPYAASMRNSVPVPSPNQLHRTAAPNMSSPTTTQTPAIVPTSSVPVISVPQIPVASAITSSHRESITTTLSSTRGTHSPRGHSPTRERDSYSSNVSSLSRGSVTPVSLPYSSASASSNLSSSLAFSKAAAWNSSPAGVVPPSIGPSSSQLSPAPPRPTPPPPTVAPPSMHPFPTPMFPPPLAPPPVSAPSPLSLQPNTNPFSADTLFQSNQADMLRRELDNRFLASQDRSLAVVAAPSYIRTEMHQHQHHHTHVHQHAAPILPPPPAPSAVVPPPSLFPPPLFKEIPKMGSVDSPFYRQNLGLSSYPSYSAGLLHPGLGGPTPFVPPNHLPAFQPKKSGKWNAMHVRVAWEIYHHQQKQQSDLKPGATKVDLLRPPTHMFPGGLVHPSRPHELPFHRGPPFDTSPHPGSLFAAPPTQFAPGINPFGRYGSTFPNPGSPFGISPFPPPSRDIATLGSLHDPWSRSVSALQRTVASYPPAPGHWALKPDPVVLERREQEERERERIRRERERERERERKQQLEQQERERERERDRREKERREMERRELERLHQQRLAESKVVTASRERSPLRNGTTEDVRVKEEPRPKDEDLLSRTDPRYNPYLRHPPNSLIPPPRGVMPAGLAAPSLPGHFPPPPGSGWPPPGSDPFRDPYRFEPLRYNPLMEAAMRVEEERVKMFGSYASQHHLRPAAKDPASMLHLRPTVGSGPPPPQTKEDSSQSR